MVEAEAEAVLVAIRTASNVSKKAIWRGTAQTQQMKGRIAREEVVASNVMKKATSLESVRMKELGEVEVEETEGEFKVVVELATNARKRVTLLRNAPMTLLTEEGHLKGREEMIMVALVEPAEEVGLKDGKMRITLGVEEAKEKVKIMINGEAVEELLPIGTIQHFSRK